MIAVQQRLSPEQFMPVLGNCLRCFHQSEREIHGFLKVTALSARVVKRNIAHSHAQESVG